VSPEKKTAKKITKLISLPSSSAPFPVLPPPASLASTDFALYPNAETFLTQLSKDRKGLKVFRAAVKAMESGSESSAEECEMSDLSDVEEMTAEDSKKLQELLLRQQKRVSREKHFNPKGRGKSKGIKLQIPKIAFQPWSDNDTRDPSAYVKDFEILIPQKKNTLGEDRCTLFQLYLQDKEKKQIVSDYVDDRKTLNKKPRWEEMKRSFLIGNGNISSWTRMSIPKFLGSLQGNLSTSAFLSDLKNKRNLILSVSQHDPHVALALNDAAVIHTFYSGLGSNFRRLGSEIMRKSLAATNNQSPEITTLQELEGLIKIDNEVNTHFQFSRRNTEGKPPFKGPRDFNFNMSGLQHEDPHLNATTRSRFGDNGKPPTKEVHTDATHVSK
jgi:hypothetical protein